MSAGLARVIRAHRHLFVIVLVLLSVAGWTAAGITAWFAHDVLTALPNASAIRGIGTMSQATTVLDSRGRQAFTIFKERRIDVPLSKVSPNLVKAIVAVEDQRFYQHGGIDVIRVAGAAITNLRTGRATQGGSTLTQQLARQHFLTPAKTLRRKVTEVFLAARLEREFTKDQILEMYLNKVYFGDGLYGVEAASLGYFGKHASDVDVPEAALLAGLAKSPSSYAPTVSVARSTARRNVVLEAMRGDRVIDDATFRAAVAAPVVLNDTLRNEEAFGEYFKEEVRKQLVQQFGWDRVYQGGLKVYTTLDLDRQKMAEIEIARQIEGIEAKQARASSAPAGRRVPVAAGPLQAALVAMNPATGEVLAMVGGRDFDRSHFNRATQARRQPGSAFKPFVYAAALEQGYTPATLIAGLDDPVMTLQGAWVPEDHGDTSELTMRTALRTSSNRAAVRMLQSVGISNTVAYAERFGLGTVPGVPSLALGSGEVTLMTMTAAYSAFANEGMLNQPFLIRRVEAAGGEVLYSAGQRPTRAVSEATAFIMSSMMADVVNAGTAAQARSLGFVLPAAGKTGTTNDYHDAWFIGFTPHLVTGVWVGYDQPRTIIRSGYAAELAVPIWAKFMAAATKGDKPDWFRAPGTVTPVSICRLSGKLPAEGCANAEVVRRDGSLERRSQIFTEYFVRGTQPVDICPLHGSPWPLNAVATSGSASTVPPTAPPAPPAAADDGGFWRRVFGRNRDAGTRERGDGGTRGRGN